ncbi:MAG: hypothetical protein IPJ48_19160 [Propionivibrio sp.]|uniref:Nucleotidyltransferase-like domain-containing protein n=1 Tax=Candidatus Propionivibrio dominans TaxID=2954373 RepID=A0A9D7FA56_9RHOO|nr:hypothetical protein [Candidatus Propionivibrio dominans]
MLGVRWGGNMKTTDMDFARPSGIALAIPDSGESINVPASIKEFDPTFFEVPMLNNKHPSTSLMSRKTKIKIDFLTGFKKTGIDFTALFLRSCHCRRPYVTWTIFLAENLGRDWLLVLTRFRSICPIRHDFPSISW